MDPVYRSNQIGQKLRARQTPGSYLLSSITYFGCPEDDPMQQSHLISITVALERTSRTFFHRIDALGIHDSKPLENFCA